MVHIPAASRPGKQSNSDYIRDSSREEAEAYFAHPVLGNRLRDCTLLVNEVEGRSAEQIFGYPDVLKFRSSMTLFASITPDNQLFTRALQKYFDGEPDRRTLEQL